MYRVKVRTRGRNRLSHQHYRTMPLHKNLNPPAHSLDRRFGGLDSNPQQMRTERGGLQHWTARSPWWRSIMNTVPLLPPTSMFLGQVPRCRRDLQNRTDMRLAACLPISKSRGFLRWRKPGWMSGEKRFIWCYYGARPRLLMANLKTS